MKNHVETLMHFRMHFFTWQFVSERKQIALMAEEKSPTRISLRRFATKSLRNEDYYVETEDRNFFGKSL